MPERTILAWLVIGLVAGVLARLAAPRRDPGGAVVSILIGIAGALLAGFVAHGAGVAAVSHWADHCAAALGAIVLLGAYRIIVARRGG